jgi:Rieske Fe-S protein
VSSRRLILTAAGATVLAGCQVYTDGAPPAADAGGAPPQAAPPQAAPPGPVVLGQVSEIPVGGGKVFAAKRVVVTQPQAGVIKAFTAVCTHQGCLVDEVSKGKINCPCHGSAFNAADGTVANGPAKRALEPKAVTVVNGQITLEG